MSRYTTLIIVIGTVLSGSSNSILTKYQDLQCVENCKNLDTATYFDQPVLQTLQMFLGELLCWVPVLIRKYQTSKSKSALNHNNETERLMDQAEDIDNFVDTQRRRPTWKDSIILAIPSTCDLLGTTLMNIGLLYTPVSIYQMTRGSVILIVGLMSVIFLQKRITKLEWVSLLVVFLGVFFVGLSGYIEDQRESISNFEDTETSLDVIIGMTLIFMGITMTAIQFVVEEHILSYLSVEPMEIVGYEGLYGSLLTIIVIFIGYIVYGKGYFDIVIAFRQIFENNAVLYSSVLIMFSISIFNFCGITLTNLLSATSRSTIDTSRTLLVWLISLVIGWEQFHWLQLAAFTLLVSGTLSFNGIVQPENWAIVPNWLKDLEGELHT